MLQINYKLLTLKCLSEKYYLDINTAKSKVQLFVGVPAKRRCTNKINISLNGKQLPLVSCARDLGLDDILKFLNHISNIYIQESLLHFRTSLLE